jgi:hypothetical protein
MRLKDQMADGREQRLAYLQLLQQKSNASEETHKW